MPPAFTELPLVYPQIKPYILKKELVTIAEDRIQTVSDQYETLIGGGQHKRDHAMSIARILAVHYGYLPDGFAKEVLGVITADLTRYGRSANTHGPQRLGSGLDQQAHLDNGHHAPQRDHPRVHPRCSLRILHRPSATRIFRTSARQAQHEHIYSRSCKARGRTSGYLALEKGSGNNSHKDACRACKCARER